MANLWTLKLPKTHEMFEDAYRKLHATIAVGAGIYSTSYAILLFTDVDRLTWSQALAPCSAVAWFSVWLVPAVLFTLSKSGRR